MVDPADPNSKHSTYDTDARAPRSDNASSVTGRSASVREIGRELIGRESGDLDFEPDDLLASLRPFEPDSPPSNEPHVSRDALDKTAQSLGGNLSASALGQPTFIDPTHAPVAGVHRAPPSATKVPPRAARSHAYERPTPDGATAETATGGFVSASLGDVPHTLSPPSLGHNLARAQSIAPIAPLPAAAIDPNGPDECTVEASSELEELVVLPDVREEALSFSHERSAASHLDHLGLTESFEYIAELLASEAKAPRHPQERAELGSVASELFALCGRKEDAKRCLNDVPSASLPFAASQSRQLTFEPTNLAQFGQVLRNDLRSSGTHESRRHLMTLYADVARLIGTDEGEQRRHLELSLRAFPTDPRFQLERLASQLAESTTNPRVRAPAFADGLGHTETIRDLFCLRNLTEGPSESSHPLRIALSARTQLRNCRHDATIAALEKLRGVQGLELAATWLIVGMAFHSPQHHAQVQSLLESLLEKGDPDAELPWLEHRLEQPSSRPSSVELFSLGVTQKLAVADRLALALAVGADQETLRVLTDSLRESLTENDELVPWSIAVQQALHRSDELDGLDPIARCQWSLGTGLGTSPDPSADRGGASWYQPGLSLDTLRALSLCEQAEYDPILTATLKLWHFTHGGSLTSVASSLVALLPQWTKDDRPFLQVLAAILFDHDASRGQSQALLQDYLDNFGSLEVVVRALVAQSSELPRAALIENLLDTIAAGHRRDALTVELLAIREAEVRLRPAERTGAWLSPNNDESQDRLGRPTLSTPLLIPFVALLVNDSETWNKLELLTSHEDEQSISQLLSDYASDSGVLRPSAQPEARISTLAGALHGKKPPREGPIPECLQRIASALSGLETTPHSAALADWQWLSDHLASPVASQIANRIAETLDPDLERFELRLKSAIEHDVGIDSDVGVESQSDSQSDAALNQFHQLQLAAVLDPEREVGLGSVRTSQIVLSCSKFDFSAQRTDYLVRAAREGLCSVASRAAILARRLGSSGSTRDECANAYAWLAWSGMVLGDGDVSRLTTAYETLDFLSEPADSEPAWSIRRRLVRARTNQDDAAYLGLLQRARAVPSESLDSATLALRAAESALRSEQWDLAEVCLNEACALSPEHLVALSMRAEFQEARGNTQQAAAAFEALAEASSMAPHKVAAFLHAAALHGSTPASATAATRLAYCLEQALHLDPDQGEAFIQLREHYQSSGQFERLESLLTTQLLVARAPDTRATLEVDRAHVLLSLGRVDEARGGLERALSLLPDHEATLILLSEVLETEHLYEEAELHLLTLAQLTTNEAHALLAYRRLAGLYEAALEQPARAEVAYREIIKRDPTDPAGEKLVAFLLNEDNTAAAIEVLAVLIERVHDTPLERDRTLELARIYDAQLGDRRRAEEILEKARRRYPHDAAVLRAQAEFFLRARDHAAFSALIDRSLTEARRALGAGRFEANFFEVIAVVGELRDTSDMAQVAHATLAAIRCEPSPMPGIGVAATHESLADCLAPEVLSLPLRALLRRTGSILSSVVPIDLRSMRAVPLEDLPSGHVTGQGTGHAKALANRLRSLAHGFGIDELKLYLSPALDTVCQPADLDPPALIVGPGYVALEDEAVRDALAIRALRILSSNTTALAHTSPVELWPLLAAYLTVHLTDYTPAGVDAKRVETLRATMRKALRAPIDHDMPMLAADVVATIGNRASQLGVAAQQWGSRTALLSVGDPSAVLCAVASAAGQSDKFDGGSEGRLKWILRNPEARDIAIFSVSDAYLGARTKRFG